MKKLIYAILFAVVFCNCVYAQSGWVRQNPLPQGNMLFDVKYLNDYTGYMVGEGVILKTTNGGASIINLPAPTNAELNSVWFCDFNTGYIAGGSIGGGSTTYDGLILKTTNGGNSWNTLVSGIISLWGSYFFDANTGFVCGGNGNILKTTNGGINWNAQASGTTTSLWGIKFINTQTGFITGGSFNPNQSNMVNEGTILKTTNGGTNWTAVISGQPYCYFSVQFPNSTTGYVSGSDGIILKSADGGNNWSIQNSGTTKYLFGLYATDVSTVTACGVALNGIANGGIIIRTTNGGTNWNSCISAADTNSFCISVYYPSTNTGYAVGNGGAMFKTVNGGANFTAQSYAATYYQINSIFFKNDYGFAAAGHWDNYETQVVTTTNGGNYWSRKNTIQRFYSNAIYMLDANTGYMCGFRGSYPNDTGLVYKTINGGVNWTNKLTVTQYTEFYTLYFSDVNTGYVFGSGTSGGNYKTTDGGNSWNQFYIPNIYGIVTASSFLNINTGYVTGGYGSYVAKTTDGGNNWTVFNNVGNKFNTISAPDFNNVYVTGDTNIIYRTNNGGSSWTPYVFNLYPNAKFASIHFPTVNNGYAVVRYGTGTGGTVFATTNAGSTWTQQAVNTNGDLNSVYFVSALTGYIGGDNGGIFKTTTGGSIWVSKISSEVPDKFALYQNYPNPFNPTTYIKYQIRNTNIVSLKIFDLLGKEIETLVDEKQTIGTYEVNWNASQYPSGVYFYRLTTDGFSDTKKMILIK